MDAEMRRMLSGDASRVTAEEKTDRYGSKDKPNKEHISPPLKLRPLVPSTTYRLVAPNCIQG